MPHRGIEPASAFQTRIIVHFTCNTVPHGAQITVHSTCQHSTIWCSDHRAFHLSTQYHMVVRSSFHQSTQYHMVLRSSCIPPVNTVPHGAQIIVPPVNTAPHGAQIIVHSTCQHSTTWCSDHRAFHLSSQYHMVLRSTAQKNGRRGSEVSADPSTRTEVANEEEFWVTNGSPLRRKLNRQTFVKGQG